MTTDWDVKFWARVHIPNGEPNACWTWTGPRHSLTGRGLFSGPVKLVQAHRYAYERINGPIIPASLFVLHTCGNGDKGCVNPAHLYVGTQLDNMRDRKARGVPYENGRGVGYRSKVTPDQVREIRRRVAEGESRAAVARDFGISRMQAATIAARRSWKHVA